MRPSPAEVARTLASGYLPGSLQVAYRPGAYQVRHITDPAGRVLLLVSIVSNLALALRPAARADDVAVVLDVRDLPPGAGAPSLGRVRVSGWAAALRGDEARAAALDFVDVDATEDLLDVGRRFTLYRFEPAEVRLDRAGTSLDIQAREYAAAEPDPLHPVEWDLLTALADHHDGEVAEFLRRQLGSRVTAGDPPARVVRLDRYGMLVAAGPAGRRFVARLGFPRVVGDHAELARLLRLATCPPVRENRPAAPR